MRSRRFKPPHCTEPGCAICKTRAKNAKKQRDMYERRKDELRKKRGEAHKKRLEDKDFRERYIKSMYEGITRILKIEAKAKEEASLPILDAELDAILFYGGFYKTVHDFAKPHVYVGHRRPRVNFGFKLYDLWLVTQGRWTLKAVLPNISWYRKSENAEAMLQSWIDTENRTGVPLVALYGAELVITNRPNRDVIFRVQWGERLKG